MQNRTSTKNSLLDAIPERLQQPLLKAKRVLLVANNPSISPDTLDKLLKPDDFLVLFNHFIQADYFAANKRAKTLPKLIFCRQIGDSALHFGMPPRHNNIPSIETMIKHADIGFLFSNINYQFPSLEDDPSPNDDPIDDQVQLTMSHDLQALIQNRSTSRKFSDTHPVVADYPVFENIHSSAPSSGFLLYRLMLAIQLSLKSFNTQAFKIILLGFNPDRQTSYFWHGHNWAFERQEMQQLPKGVELIQQY